MAASEVPIELEAEPGGFVLKRKAKLNEPRRIEHTSIADKRSGIANSQRWGVRE